MTDEQPEPGTMQHYAHNESGCDTWIPGVPTNIPRARVLELVKSLGFDPHQTKALCFEPYAVYAEVYALKDGQRYWDGGPIEEAATHRLAIPISDQGDTPSTPGDVE